jgi:signal transduction histidine kinase
MSSRILIIDDSEDDVEMLRRFLLSEDTLIRGLTDSTQAESVFTEFEPDLVLLDLHMPEPDGMQILRQLRDARIKQGFLPVLVLTGDVGRTARNAALQLGADDFLTKPLDREEVVLRARNLLSARRLHMELARAYRHKSDFLASMSHELRTPLTSIIGFSELLITDANGRFDAETRSRFLNQINSGGKDMLVLINDVLDLSKVEAGLIELQIERVLVADIVTSVLSTIEPLAATKGIRVQAELSAALYVSADPGKLRQMLLNLVSNAVKFTPSSGRVAIEVRRLEGAVEISVTDTGIGIAESDRGRLFEAFRQIDSPSASHQQGTGLGLALTKRYVELHGGKIHFVSEVGKGSIFTLSLPLAVEGAQVPVLAPNS